jgi:hypothetical protein
MNEDVALTTQPGAVSTAALAAGCALWNELARRRCISVAPAAQKVVIETLAVALGQAMDATPAELAAIASPDDVDALAAGRLLIVPAPELGVALGELGALGRSQTAARLANAVKASDSTVAAASPPP